jgi:hypothetical protein
VIIKLFLVAVAKSSIDKVLRKVEKILKIINDLFVRLYFNIQVLGRQPLSLNVMSIRFSADSIGAPLTQGTSTFITASSNYHQNGEMSVNESDTMMVNSNCSKMETQSLMDTSSPQGRQPQGTPDAEYQASNMSSDFKNSNINNNQQQQQAFGESVNMQDMFTQLSESLALEPKYQPNLFLPQQSNVS